MLTMTKSAFVLMIGLIFSSILGLILIPFLRKRKIFQNINAYVPEHDNKKTTPSMGGLIFIIPTFVITVGLLVTHKIEWSTNLLIILFVMMSYAFIGFLDDFISLKSGKNKGLKIWQKLILQLIVAIVFYILYLHFGSGNPVLKVTLLGIDWNLNIFYVIFILFLLVGTSNAVNLTDGLDGLAGGLSVIAFVSYGLLAWGSYYIEGYKDIAIFCFILSGSIIGFLLFNTHPAKIFMGDTGSLALGGTLAAVAILTQHELSLAVIGGVFVIETLSAIIQIISFRCFHKRVFKMAPLHHHFQRMGWSEQDIVKLFWVVGFILALSALIYGVWI